MNSPVCNVALRMADRERVELDYRPKCRGVWLDRGELDKIIERSIEVLDDNEAGVRGCPDHPVIPSAILPFRGEAEESLAKRCQPSAVRQPCACAGKHPSG